MGLCRVCCVEQEKNENKIADEEDEGEEEKKSCRPSLPISVSQSDEVIKHQPALYINDATARDFWTPCPQRLLGWKAEEDFLLI